MNQQIAYTCRPVRNANTMRKVVRPTYPLEFSIGLLLLIFALSFFLSGQLFEVPENNQKNVYPGMFLASASVIVMLLVLWEEFLFPVHVKPLEDVVIFRNHRNKLVTQILIFLIIPVMLSATYFLYEVNIVRFAIWSAICFISPIAGKLISGLKNYNDFLKLTNDSIEYKNNELTGSYPVRDLRHIELVKDEDNVLHKITLSFLDGKTVTIDLDEMELEAYYQAIYQFISAHSVYKTLVQDR